MARLSTSYDARNSEPSGARLTTQIESKLKVRDRVSLSLENQLLADLSRHELEYSKFGLATGVVLAALGVGTFIWGALSPTELTMGLPGLKVEVLGGAGVVLFVLGTAVVWITRRQVKIKR
jgi:hypothetical protein